MVSETNFDYLLRVLREKREATITYLLNQPLKDFNEFSNLRGQIRGIEYAENEIKNLAKKLETSDE